MASFYDYHDNEIFFSQGRDGEPGLPGPQGEQGAPGLAGVRGLQGQVGPKVLLVHTFSRYPHQ